MTTVLKIGVFLLLIVLAKVNSCKQSAGASLPVSGYISWVENPGNGLAASKEIDGIIYSVQYKPLQYEVLLQEKRMLTQEEMIREMDSLSDMQYYTFRMQTVNGADLHRYGISEDHEYYSRLEYFSLGMQNDVSLIDGKDTLPCLMFHYERTYGIDPRACFVLAFDAGSRNPGKKTLMYNDRVFGAGPVMLSIDAASIEEIPQLILSE